MRCHPLRSSLTCLLLATGFAAFARRARSELTLLEEAQQRLHWLQRFRRGRLQVRLAAGRSFCMEVTPCCSPSLLPAAANVVAKSGQAMEDVVASQVSVRDLKTHLSQWLARAQAGEVVEVTSHRRPIARITAVKPADQQASINPLQNAIDAGVIHWNGQTPLLPPPVRLNDHGPLMSDIVIEDRGEMR